MNESMNEPDIVPGSEEDLIYREQMFVETPSEHETESEEDFLRRILRVLGDQTMRSAMNAVVARELIAERLDPEYAASNREQFGQDPVWGKR